MKKSNLFKFSWFGLGFISILLGVITIFTWTSLDRNESSLTFLLTERAKTLLNLTERVLLTGKNNNLLQIQHIAEEVTNTEGFRFLIITDGDGNIIAHSDPSRVGKKIKIDRSKSNEINSFDALDVNKKAEYSILKIDGKISFVAYKELLPAGGRNHYMHSKPMFVRPNGEPITLYGFVGQDIDLYDQTMLRTRTMLLLASSGIFFVAMVLSIILQFSQRNKELLKRHEEAEKLAEEMLEKVHELEDDLRQKEKLAAIGDLTAGVAHEIRNPLSSIKGYATYFKQIFPQDSSEEKAAKIMIEEVDRLNRAIEDLIGVTRSTDVKLTDADISDICSKICFLLEPEARQKGLEIVCKCSEQNSIITQADPDRLRQAILNIALNAMESFNEGKTQEKKVILDLVKEKSSIVIIIQDNGSGIPQEILNRVFDPYFTTKSKGTGLGLVMAKNIIDAHNGKLKISSSENGTEVKIYIPMK